MATKTPSCFVFGEFRMDLENNRVTMRGEPVILTQKCFELLRFILLNRDRILKKNEILKSVWAGTYVNEATLTQHMYMLRKALRCNGESAFPVATVPKLGYRFDGAVREVFHDDSDNSFPPDGFATTEFRDKQILIEDESRNSELSTVNHSFFGRRKLVRRALAIVAASLVAIILAEIFYLHQTSTVSADLPNKLAVLPFQELAPRAQHETFGLGLTDQLISRLGRIENLRVLPINSVAHLSDATEHDLFEVGRQLSADAVMTGTIQRDRNIVRVNVQIFCTKTRSMLLSETIDGTAADLFDMQDTISQKVVGLLSPTIKHEIDRTQPAEE